MKATPTRRDAATALVGDGRLLRDLFDERFYLDRFAETMTRVLQFDGHAIHISGGVHELERTARQPFHAIPDLLLIIRHAVGEW